MQLARARVPARDAQFTLLAHIMHLPRLHTLTPTHLPLHLQLTVILLHLCAYVNGGSGAYLDLLDLHKLRHFLSLHDCIDCIIALVVFDCGGLVINRDRIY